MSVAIDRGDYGAMVAAVIAMIVMIVVVDQLFWRPLVAWSNKFKFEDIAASTVTKSWVLELLRRTRFYAWLRERRDADQEVVARGAAGQARRARARPEAVAGSAACDR